MRFTPICNHHHAWMAEIQVWRVLVLVTYYRNTQFADCPLIPVDVGVYWLRKGEWR